MSVSEINAEQKSVMLARLCGWKMEDAPRGYPAHVLDETGKNIFPWESFDGDVIGWAGKYPNLYDPANMALAWRVLNWASMQDFEDTNHTWCDVVFDRICVKSLELFDLPPEKAQTQWLDKILELAIEAGRVELEASK